MMINRVHHSWGFAEPLALRVDVLTMSDRGEANLGLARNVRMFKTVANNANELERKRLLTHQIPKPPTSNKRISSKISAFQG